MKKNHLFNSNYVFMLLIMLGSVACDSYKSIEVKNMSVEYLSNPYGVDIQRPRFSWNFESDVRGVSQESWQIIVDENPNDIDNGIGKVWDSGKVMSDRTVNVEYDGIALKSNTKYYWRIHAWLNDGNSIWSESGFFHTGILNVNEWEASWISLDEEITHASPLLRKEFQATKEIEQAVAYVTASGFYEFFLNGEKVGDHVLDPGVTDYRETILYSTYDVTSLVKKGNNVAGAILGNGAWNLRKKEDRWSWGKGGTSFGNPVLWVQLMITYSDGSQDIVVTDDTWKTTESPITFNNLYGGEDYDARKELPGWSSANYDNSDWQTAAVVNAPGGELKSQLMQPIKVTNTLEPVSSINPEPGVFLFDLGQNIAGWWQLEIQGTPGQSIHIRGDETLNNDLFPKQLEKGDKISDNTRYHPFIWTEYTLKSNDMEYYEPSFFYSGFRYIQVTSSDKQNPQQLKVKGRVVRSANPRNGRFESSDSLLNRIHRAGLWSQKSNMQSYPTDCPHREKGAYNGDGQVIAEASMHDFHMAPFYTKWINDMLDSQEENGRIPNTSPVLVGGMGGGVAWGSAYILIPWWMSYYYEDSRILEQHYSSMKEYINYLKELGTKDEDPSEPFIIDNFDGYWYSLGEWCAPGQKDGPNHAVVNTFYYYYNNRLMSEIAGELGFDEDAKYYQNFADTIKHHFNRRFFNNETGLYGTEETYQTYQLLALVGDLVPESYRSKVFQTIVDDIKIRGNHLNTGIIGTKYLWPVLVKNGENELAYQIATQSSYPSYGYWINNGSTTLLEEWSGENSHNHQMFGSVTEYFYKFLAGIQSPMEGNTTKGYSHIHIEPYVPQELEFVEASLETVSGWVSSDWQKDGKVFKHEVTIPANTSATISLPISEKENVVVWEGESKVWENNQPAEKVNGIRQIEKKGDRLMINTGSGKYKFRVETI